MSTLLPEYYSSTLDRVVKKSVRLRNEQTVNFVFITDMHHYAGGEQLHGAEALVRLSQAVPLDFIVSGGDMSLNGPKSAVIRAQKEISDGIAAASAPMLPIKGNHDDNSVYGYNDSHRHTRHVLFSEETFDLVFHRLDEVVTFDETNRNGMYYYMDLTEKRTRVVVLNCIDIPYLVKPDGGLKYQGQWKYVFSDKQLNWVAHRALNLRDKPDREQWQVIFFSHVAILQDNVSGADFAVKNGEAMWDIIQAFRNGIAFADSENDEEFSYELNADFTDQGAISVIACLFGHVHCDQAFMKDGIWMISTLNASCHQEFEDSPERIVGTATETAFDLMMVDCSAVAIHAVRIGAGEDRTIA